MVLTTLASQYSKNKKKKAQQDVNTFVNKNLEEKRARQDAEAQAQRNATFERNQRVEADIKAGNITEEMSGAEARRAKENQKQSSTPYALTDAEGNPAGATFDGRNFVGLSEKDARKLIELQNQKLQKDTLANGSLEERNASVRIENTGQGLARDVGNITPEQQAIAQALQGQTTNPDYTQALLAGGAAGLTGAAAGALGGLLTTGGAASIPAALGLGVSGFIVGFRQNLQTQLNDQIKTGKTDLADGKTALGNYINGVNADPQNAALYLDMFNTQLALIDQEYARIFSEAQRTINKAAGADGTLELARYESFNQNLKPYYIQKMTLALANPNPAAVDMNSIIPQDTTEESSGFLSNLF